MKTLFTLGFTAIGLMATGSAANAQYFYGYNHAAQVYVPPGYGYGYNPGYYNGYIPGVNQTTISVSPYWRPLVINTPVVTTPFGPNYYYSNNYAFRTTPYGYNWAASRYQWVEAGYYTPPVIAYQPYINPGFVRPAAGIAPAVVPAPVPVAAAPRARITRGFVPAVNPLTGGIVMPVSYETTNAGSFTPWGVYVPSVGGYVNPFSGAVVR